MRGAGLARLYASRFSPRDLAAKDEVWQVLCREYFQKLVEPDSTVLDIACGAGEFIRHIRAARKLAVDLNPDVSRQLPAGVEFHCTPAHRLHPIGNATVDVCFASNFFEHLPSRRAMDAVLREARRVLKPRGRFICMQPNIRYASGKYWDFYDHVVPLSHLSMAEAFAKNGYRVDLSVPRFVPFSSKSAYPKHPWLVSAYLRCPPLWRLLGGQFVLVASPS